MNAPERNIDGHGFYVPPHSIEAEQSVLGALLIDNDAFDRLGELRAEHFYRFDHRIIFECVSRLAAKAQVVDVMTVFEALDSKAADVGGLEYLNSIAQGAPGSSNVGRYAEMVVTRWKLRGLISAADEISGMAYARNGRTAEELIDAAQQRLEQLVQSKASEPRLARDGLSEVIEDLDAQFHGTAKPVGVMTGFSDLDAAMGGLGDGDLVVVAGRPAMGKSALTQGIAEHVAQHYGPVLTFSMEMPAKQLNQRTLSRIAGIPLSRIRDGAKLLESDWPLVTHGVTRISEMPLFVDDKSGLSLNEIASRSRAIKRKHGLKLVVIDYLGLMTLGDGERHDLQIGAVTRGLKGLAKATRRADHSAFSA